MGQEFDEAYAEEVPGWGWLGYASEREALPQVISLWLNHDADPEAIVWLCLIALEREWPEPQIAALQAFTQLCGRLPALPRREEVIKAVATAREHTDPQVRAAAIEAWEVVGGNHQ